MREKLSWHWKNVLQLFRELESKWSTSFHNYAGWMRGEYGGRGAVGDLG